jgi:hypothetical protein
MANTYTIIDKATVGSGGTSSVTFSSIPQTFTDLKIVASARSVYSDAFDVLRVYFNGSDTNGNFIEIYGYNSATGYGSASQQRLGYISGNTATSNTFGSSELYIPNYTSSNFKSSSADSASENNSALAVTSITTNLWSSTSAITSITLFAGAGNLMQHSSFYLYGIKNS